MNRKLIVVADSHVIAGGELERQFFEMLARVSDSENDILFLGDNVDLWIASAPKYETDLHRRFLDWCRSEKTRRRVLLVEGNHEFYVCRHHSDCFSQCTESMVCEEGTLFVHGDMSQRRMGFHRLFRLFAKNWFGDFVMSWLPFGVEFARKMKGLLSHDARTSGIIPYEAVEPWVKTAAATYGCRDVIMGHFHRGERKQLGTDVTWTIVPAWRRAGEIGVYDEQSHALQIGAWQELLG